MRYKTTNQKMLSRWEASNSTFRTLSRPDVSCTTKSRRRCSKRWLLAGDNGSRLKTQGTTDWKWLACPFLLGGLEHVFFPIYWGFNNPNWLIFFRGVAQPPTRFLVLSIQWSGYPIWSHTHLAISKNWNIPKQPDTIGIPTEKHVQKLEWFWGHAFKNPLYQILYIIYIWYLKMFTWFDFYST